MLTAATAIIIEDFALFKIKMKSKSLIGRAASEKMYIIQAQLCSVELGSIHCHIPNPVIISNFADYLL